MKNKNNELYVHINDKIKNNLNSKFYAVVTGGCGRIGSVFTSLLLSQGYNLIILSRSNNSFKNYTKLINPIYKKKIQWKKLDLTKSLSIDHVVKYLKKKQIKILVNNASQSNRGKFFNYNSESLNKEIWGTFTGSMYLTEKILPQLRKKNDSRIIFTGSLWGNITPRFNIYKKLDIGPSPVIAAGKSALMQYAKFLAERESVFKIRINSILPGWFPRKGKIERKDYVNRIKKNIPLNRLGKLEDLVSAIEFLISDKSSYITGHELVIDGGYSLS